MIKPSCYEILKITPLASADEVRKAFRRLALQMHPDHGGDEAQFRELKQAFEEALQAATTQVRHHTPTPLNGRYDPFTDPAYATYLFFEPANDAIARFERHVYAKGCPHCQGKGFITKLVEPNKGFMGLQERFCVCQKIGAK